MKTIKIAVIAMMGMSLGVNAQHNYDNQNTIYSKDGNVGIGTSQPNAKLDIRGTSTFGFLPTHKLTLKKPKELFFANAQSELWKPVN